MKKENKVLKLQAASQETQNFLKQVAGLEKSELLRKLGSTEKGLAPDQIEKNRDAYGANKVTREKKKTLPQRLAEAFINPFTVILFVLAGVSTVTDIILPWRAGDWENFNPVTVCIILTLLLISGCLRFIQEARSGDAAAKLLELITTTCTVIREGKRREVPLQDVVAGDLVFLSTGDMVPADLRILEAKDLFVSQSSLTGESAPQEKVPAVATGSGHKAVTELDNLAFMGTNVISGSATGVVVRTGDKTLFGSLASSMAQEAPETNFTKGVNSVSWVLIRFMMAMVPIVFVVNGMTKGDWVSAFLFAISVAVGLTPEMLPMIVTTCLAKGAVSMSEKKTVVKNLNSIQSFGAMDVLCTDKTGTLTQDKVVLEYHLDAQGQSSQRVLRYAYLNSYFQTGYKNFMDRGIIKKTEEEENADPRLVDLSENYKKVDEIPFDFARRRLSVVVTDPKGRTQMITKGAVEEMLQVCSHVEENHEPLPLTDALRKKICSVADHLNEEGMRVIALARKINPSPVGAFGVKDENGMVLLGYLAFLDPPKDSAAEAIAALKDHGVTTKVLTGDNEKTTRCICRQVGLPVEHILLGSDLDNMDEKTLEGEVERTTVFAKLSPDQKARVVEALQAKGHTVGFMGDGINDAPALKNADIGISVDSAVDIAKESADIILLEKSLMVLEQGIVEGRKTYANMIKYIKMTASSNFGNMFSVLAASALLPFLPMSSLQLIILNLLYEISCIAIPWDNVDEEYLKVPRNWDAGSIGSFMLWLGPTSSVFDWITYLVLYFVICPQFISGGLTFNHIPAGTKIAAGAFAGMDMRQAYTALFQAGWFVESMWTQTLVIHMIRTPKIPFIQSHASATLTMLTTSGIALCTLLPFTGSLGRDLGFLPLPGVYFGFLALVVLAYMLLATSIKKAYIRHYGSLL
ncbi:magnesium-translocating P-type ATPase [uncultured Acidaminococcus sp.]|uniref:magnesium-translocating P-type ATPase n=1 Tax=uncultured Acidaminococcus sp. TaxID=352152 RepID=UPI0025993E9E|nr:magnesium-translocating P-type ATPase [uncultured Acidaminococcus sp.]